MLLNIYDCRKGIGSKLDSSFLEKDCTTFCYKGSHMKWAIVSGFVIVTLLTFVTYNRPRYESIQKSLHLKTKPIYIQISSVFQVVLVAINKCLKGTNQSTAGFIQTGVILAFITLTAYMKPYNYSKTFIFKITILSMSAFAILISAIFIRLDYFTVWIIVELVGLLMILMIGFIVIKAKAELLYEEKGLISIEELFRFQFFGQNRILYKMTTYTNQEK